VRQPTAPASDLHLIGYHYSVYTWAVRMGIAEAGLTATYQEADPFEAPEALRGQHPFGRVPVLWDGDFRLYETAAILGYLLPASSDRREAARARQVAGIIDSYAYRPLVRQVFSHGFFRPACGETADAAVMADGLATAPRVLAALEEIMAERRKLDAGCACHLAPMLGYFAEVPAGRQMLAEYPALEAWFADVQTRESYRATRPDLMQLGEVT